MNFGYPLKIFGTFEINNENKINLKRKLGRYNRNKIETFQNNPLWLMG